MYDPIGVPVAVVQPDGTYALREQSEAYGHEFASESDELKAGLKC
jgi:hypothetical protein